MNSELFRHHGNDKDIFLTSYNMARDKNEYLKSLMEYSTKKFTLEDIEDHCSWCISRKIYSNQAEFLQELLRSQKEARDFVVEVVSKNL